MRRLLLVAAALLGARTHKHAAHIAPIDVPETAARFVVITQPRSGSTWFVKYSRLFAQCPGVVTAGEAPLRFVDYVRYVRGTFDELGAGRGWRGELAAAVGEPNLAASLRSFSPVRAVGFKLMYAQLPLHGPGAPVAESGMLRNVTLKGFLKYAAQSKIAVVHLVRLNHLERFISLAAIDADPAASYHAPDGAPTALSRSGAPASRVTVDVAKALLFARAQARQNRHLQHFLDASCGKFGATCVTVAHEHLVGDGAPAYFRAVRNAIGLGRCARRRRRGARGAGDDDVATLGHGGVDDASEWVPCAARVANWGEVAASREFNGTLWRDLCEAGTPCRRGRAPPRARRRRRRRRARAAAARRRRRRPPPGRPRRRRGGRVYVDDAAAARAASFENKANFVAADGTLKDRSFRARLGPARPRGGDDAGEPRNDPPET
ncbi:hypothetical protein JL722_13086 [Aureococcus anophagefferens]|nr:hypothetical protein JL722_13086 [Aureococcus anophagefferens]